MGEGEGVIFFCKREEYVLTKNSFFAILNQVDVAT